MAVMNSAPISPLQVFLLVVFVMESLVSLLGNGFVLAVNGHSWLHSKKMLPCDFLLTTLSLSRFLLQWMSMSTQFVYFSSPETFIDSEKEKAFACSWVYLNAASLWCATWLNVFYCVKVTNFAHPLFGWLKLRIGVLVPRFLGLSLLIFIICSIAPVVRAVKNKKCHNLTQNLPQNTSQSEAQHPDSIMILNILQIYSTTINISICLTASLVLVLSLWRHQRNLKKGGLSTKDLSTQAHLSVMKTLVLSLFFYLLHIVAMILIFARFIKYSQPEQLICEIFLFLYPSAHSVILIFTNPKLRKVCTYFLTLRRSASGREHELPSILIYRIH